MSAYIGVQWWRVGAAYAEEESHDLLLEEKEPVYGRIEATQYTHIERERERGTKSYIFINKRQQLQMNNNLCKRLQSHFI